jgi:hypothetical protein
MYCPQCATANPADVKFCRSCGLELETLVLALTKKPAKKPGKAEPTDEDWLDLRIKGVSGLTRGGILMAVSLLLILPFALFLPASFDAPWILIWTVFFGWMTVWGGIEVAYGLSSLLESKNKLRFLKGAWQEMAIDAKHPEPMALKDNSETHPEPRGSITERTTRHLKD